MSQTRSEVLKLLKQFDQDFEIFDGVEESLIFALVQGRLTGSVPQNINWERLSKAAFALPHLYVESRRRAISDLPDWFFRQAQSTYLHQVSSNETRLLQIQELARLFEEGGVKALFLKGAAEITYSQDDVDFLGCRYMCDIDILCSPEDLARADELLQSAGYKMWDHDLKHWSREDMSKFTLDRYCHYIYNAYERGYMELHGYVAVGPNRGSYPRDFERLLFEESRQIDLRGIMVWVPKPDHLLVYALCHAASRSNNQQVVYLDGFQLDQFARTDCAVSPPVLANGRLDITQLRFLLQFKHLLCRFGQDLCFADIQELLAQVVEKDLIEMYTVAASFTFKESFPLQPQSSLEAVKHVRKSYLFRFMLPILAERIESILVSRLEQITDDHINRQVEKISLDIERRVVQRLTLGLIDYVKTLLSRQLAKFPIRRPTGAASTPTAEVVIRNN
jgi:hypothetical protein